MQLSGGRALHAGTEDPRVGWQGETGVARINYFGEPRGFMLSLRYQPNDRD